MVLRRIFRPKRKEGIVGCCKLHNELRKLHSSSKIRRRWFGNGAHMEEIGDWKI
jgi:hypothetical protein